MFFRNSKRFAVVVIMAKTTEGVTDVKNISCMCYCFNEVEAINEAINECKRRFYGYEILSITVMG